MYDDELKTEEMELDTELSPEEEAALDRFMRETAEKDSADIDFDGLHTRILEAAKKEGIVVFPKRAKSSRDSFIRRMLPGAAAAAAVFVVGLAVLAILNRLPKSGTPNGQTAYADTPTGGDKVVFTDAPRMTESMLLPTNIAEPTALVIPTESFDIDNSTKAPEITALPTEYPVKGGTAGYTVLASFTQDPVSSLELLPDGYSDRFKKVVAEEDALSASATGEDEDGLVFYSCRVTDVDDSIAVGVARYTLNEAGLLRFVWRVTEDCCLDIIVEGFDRPAAEELLLTLALCDESFSTLLDAA